MTVSIYSVDPVQGGWAVSGSGSHQTLVFLSGAKAEATARKLGMAASYYGAEAEVRIHDRHGQLVGRWSSGSGATQASAA